MQCVMSSAAYPLTEIYRNMLDEYMYHAVQMVDTDQKQDLNVKIRLACIAAASFPFPNVPEWEENCESKN